METSLVTEGKLLPSPCRRVTLFISTLRLRRYAETPRYPSRLSLTLVYTDMVVAVKLVTNTAVPSAPARGKTTCTTSRG